MNRRHALNFAAQCAAIVCTAAAAWAQTPTPSASASPTMSPVASPSVSATPSASPSTSPTTSGSTSPSPSGTPSVSSLTAVDQAYFTVAVQGDLFEIASGNLAQANASRRDVKAFGQRMVTDHSQSLAQLTAFGQQNGLTVPTALSDAGQVTIAFLSTLTGTKFDSEYMQDEFVDHENDIDLARDYVGVGTNSALVALAQQSIPVLRTHLNLARKTLLRLSGASGIEAIQSGRETSGKGSGKGSSASSTASGQSTTGVSRPQQVGTSNQGTANQSISNQGASTSGTLGNNNDTDIVTPGEAAIGAGIASVNDPTLTPGSH